MDGTTLGGVTSTLTYDAFNELSELRYEYQGTVLYAEDMTNGRDKLGRIVERTETRFGVGTTFNYEYDAAGRLDVVRKAGNVDADYDYDANGNRTEAVTGAGVFFGTYDDQDRLLTYGGNTYTYNANGDLETKLDSSGFTTTYDYDELGNLMAVDLPDGRVIDYVVDGRDRRVGKKVDGALEQGFLYRDQLNPVAELDGLGQVRSRFVYGSRAHVPDYMVTAGTTYRLITDHLGSVRLVVDISNGSVAQQLDYGPWGEVLQDTNPGFQPFGFAGGLYDKDTGLVRFGARDYDPEVGRWTVKDPIGFGGDDGNLYRYTGNDPIGRIDPTGMYSSWQFFNDASNFGTGVADAASLGLGPLAREAWDDYFDDDLSDSVDRCSSAYRAGTYASLALGAGRIAYAGVAKLMTRGVPATWEAARRLSHNRNVLRRVFRVGLPAKDKPFSEVVAMSVTPQDAIHSAGRTSRVYNALGFNAGIGGAVGAARDVCECP